MKKLIPSLIRQLEGLPQGADPENAFTLLRNLASSSDPVTITREIGQWLALSGRREEVALSARETSTHYVWPLHTTTAGFQTTLNEFKQLTDTSQGYATTVHDHRYSFASLMLAGSYQQVRLAVEIAAQDRVANVRELGYDFLEVGQVVFVDHQDFHLLRQIQNGTLTLLIKCPPSKEQSTSIDIATRTARTHVPVELRMPMLIRALSGARDR